jgi:O-antigen/teichoic acid export membrane protein
LTKKLDSAKVKKAPSFEHNLLQTAKGGSFLAAGTLFAYGSRFGIAFLLARLLGVEQYGMYVLAISFSTIIASLSMLGLDSTMVRYIAIQVRNKDEDAIWGTIQIGAGFSLLVSVLMSIGLYLLAGPISVYMFDAPELASFLQLFCFFIPFSTLSGVLVDVARGFKRMDYSALGENFILFVARLILLGVLALVNLNAFTAIIAFGLSDVVVTFCLVYLLNKEFSFRRSLRRARYDYRDILTFAFPFWFATILRKFRGNFQTLLLGSLSSIAGAGIFSIVDKVTLIGHLVYSSIIASVKPILAELQDQGNWKQMGDLYTTTTRWGFICNLPIFLIMLLYPEPILAIFGASFVDGALALTVIAFGELVNAATGICGSIIDMTGQNKLKFINSLISTVIIVGGNVLLIPRWGVLGTAVATFVAMSLINILRVIQVWFLYRLHPYDATFIKPLVAAVVAAMAVLSLGRWLPVGHNLFYTIIHILVLCASYLGVLLLLGLAPEERTVLVRLSHRVSSALTSRMMRSERA